MPAAPVALPALPEAKAPEPVAATPTAVPILAPPPVPAPELPGNPRPLAVDYAPVLTLPVVDPDREDCYTLRSPHRGDSPMMRNWKTLGWHTLLAGALVATPTPAKAEEPNKDEAIARQLASLSAQLKKLQGSLDALGDSIVAAQTEGARQDLRLKAVEDAVKGMRSDMDQLKRAVDDLNRRQAAAPPRVSAYPPTAPAPTGRIRLVNSYNQPVSIVINSRVYPLNPGDVKDVEAVPTGAFTYEVLGIQGAVSRNLGANETFTITVHPR